ncbi:MAG: DUF2231 domain-containing protein [Planctomycetes bacterium]|nr:DUF2231 domain-containing protein [Planctomycetota bacterium]
MLIHFPIAFLLGGAALMFWTLRRPSEMLHRTTTGLLLTGILFGWLAAVAGGLAYFTVPAHTEAGHGLMLWHLGLGLVMLALFTWVSIARWRGPETTATKQQLAVTLVGAALLMVTSHVGGSVVFRHGAGVDPKILSREIREGHSHTNEHTDSSESNSGHHKNETVAVPFIRP